jgi:hypothetical protein
VADDFEATAPPIPVELQFTKLQPEKRYTSNELMHNIQKKKKKTLTDNVILNDNKPAKLTISGNKQPLVVPTPLTKQPAKVKLALFYARIKETFSCIPVKSLQSKFNNIQDNSQQQTYIIIKASTIKYNEILP